jgi:ubiquinone/menaquinone biosynthesis C-methylase UbiE
MEYVMGRTRAEYERLKQQARVWSQVTQRVLSAAGVSQGMHCLDVGCSIGEGMRTLGKLVGTTGSVTGIDIDPSLKSGLVEELQKEVECRFDFVEANVERIEHVHGAPFDVVYARLTLIHLRDPVAALRKLHGWVRPGGCLIIQDYDMRGLDIFPEIPAFEEFRRVFYGAFEQVGCDVKIGHKLPAYFYAAGIGEPDGTDVTGLVDSLTRSNEMILAVYRSVLPVALKLGLTTASQSEEFISAMQRAAAEPRYYSTLWPLMVSSWRRKPSE